MMRKVGILQKIPERYYSLPAQRYEFRIAWGSELSSKIRKLLEDWSSNLRSVSKTARAKQE
jgi:hypothetical protein